MKKKITAAIVLFAMLVSLTSVVWADASTVRDALYAYGASKGLKDSEIEAWLTRSVDVPGDVEVKKTGGSYSDGPMTISVQNASSASFDLKAVVDMGTVKEKFEDYMSGARYAINQTGGSNTTELLSKLQTLFVTGEFTVSVTIPEGVTLSDNDINGSNMYGFNESANDVFYEISRSFNETTRVFEVKVGVGKRIKVGETFDMDGGYNEYYEIAPVTALMLTNYFNLNEDLIYECKDITVDAFGTYKFEGKFVGNTVIDYDTATIKYTSTPLGTVDGTNHNPDGSVKPMCSVTVIVKKSGGSSGSTGSNVSLEFIVDGKTFKTITKRNKVEANVTEVVPEAKEGYEFAGWYLDEACTKKADDVLTVETDTKVYAKWIKHPSVSLETEDHFAYIKGYTDGTVRPLDTIIREEVAAIFYRLLTEESRASLKTDNIPFRDVPADKWSAEAIAALANGGIITGRPDGTFAPENCITRGEFAAIASRFAGIDSAPETNLTDISTHWAKKYIEICAQQGWITGYDDGTFKPNTYITRAEAMAIVNRMLSRSVDEKGVEAVSAEVRDFPDNIKGTWYYYIVLEAINTHEYERAENETNETWTEIEPIGEIVS